MAKPKSQRQYAMYKGDKFIMDGTLIQMAAKRKVKFETMYYYLMPAYYRKMKERGAEDGNVIRLVDLEEEEEDEANAETFNPGRWKFSHTGRIPRT